MSPVKPRRAPHSQNEHLWCIINLRGLSAHERLLAHTLHALCYVGSGAAEKPEPIERASSEYLARKCEMGRRTVCSAVQKLVEVGLFNRLDSRRGGFEGIVSAATYRPMVPEWWEPKLKWFEH